MMKTSKISNHAILYHLTATATDLEGYDMMPSRHRLKNSNIPPPPCNGSINTFDEVKSSAFVKFLSRITGQSVHVTAQKLIHNAVHIKGENVKLDVEDIEYV